MSKKRHMENSQLSLTLEHYVSADSTAPTFGPVQRQSAVVHQFPSKQSLGTSFRERVIRDLVTTRVMVVE